MAVLCDSNGGSLLEQIARTVGIAYDTLKIPVGIHTHNDGDLATATSLAAVAAGAVSRFKGTINGIGERWGNADLIAVVANLSLKKKHSTSSTATGARASDRTVSLRLRNCQHESSQQSALRGD